MEHFPEVVLYAYLTFALVVAVCVGIGTLRYHFCDTCRRFSVYTRYHPVLLGTTPCLEDHRVCKLCSKDWGAVREPDPIDQQ